MACPNCGARNRADSKFCDECGTAMARTCAACGTPLRPQARFCDECGAATSSTPGRSAVHAGADFGDRGSGVAERRLVSVVFADLVGFTAVSEHRDAEEVRELLSRYFDSSSGIVRRYGGIVEKFIGDAVMAVWGAPIAHEDDPERAVRAALDLVDMVAVLGGEIGVPELRARAGVLTGDAAVTIGAVGQGMVAGDLVNTASRIQSVAAPGTVLVGDTTRRATEAAVVYEDAGEHTMKGRDSAVRLWRAGRVVAGRRGSQKSAALEPPFVGRDRELRLVKELFHGCEENRRAHLVSLTGVAGIGKSRLLWEFEKYIDGLAAGVFWHRGRCLAYGEGVTYWALAEMVRMRAEIVEGEDPGSAAAKLSAAVATHVPDAEERRWVEPRLAHLLGLEERVVGEASELFSAWRLFFERLADKEPTVLVFEDLQWADESLLDFIDYLLEWSKAHQIYVLTMARPELSDQRPTWGAGRRNFTSLYLEPLQRPAMEEMLAGLVPGLPDELVDRILERAEGIPLYAVETVRMLLGRGMLAREGASYRLTSSVAELDVPDTLHALIAARLDGLAPETRRVLQDAAVLGKSFTAVAVGAVAGLAVDDAEARLRELVRIEVLSVQEDPRSPERGQYGFVQDLVRAVAYETLSRRDRKALHLAAAAQLESAWKTDDAEIVEVLASHFLTAYRLAPDDPDAEEVRSRASAVLLRAAERAASLAATAEAQRYFEQAAKLAGSRKDEAELLERAGQMAFRRGRRDDAAANFAQARDLFETEQMSHAAARVLARQGELEGGMGDIAAAVERMESAYAVLASDPPDADLAELAAQLARWHALMGSMDIAADRLRVALDIAEFLELPELLAQALTTEANLVSWRGHQQESIALHTHALKLALEHDNTSAALRSYNNLANVLGIREQWAETVPRFREGIALARRVGDRVWERILNAELSVSLLNLGDWGGAEALASDLAPDVADGLVGFFSGLDTMVKLHVFRGDGTAARALLDVCVTAESGSDVQVRTMFMALKALVLRAEGRPAAGLEAAETAMEVSAAASRALDYPVLTAFIQAVEAALELGSEERAIELLAWANERPPGLRPPSVMWQSARFRGRMESARGDGAAADASFATAIDGLDAQGLPFWAAVARLEHAESLTGRGLIQEAAPLVDAAAATFAELGARPWMDRIARLAPAVRVAS